MWKLICYKTAPERQTSWSEEENLIEWAFGEWRFIVAGAELTLHLHRDGLLLPHLVVMATPFFTQALLLSRESMKRATSPLPTTLPAGFPLLSGTKYPSWVRNSWAGEEAKANRGATYTARFEEWKMHRDRGYTLGGWRHEYSAIYSHKHSMNYVKIGPMAKGATPKPMSIKLNSV